MIAWLMARPMRWKLQYGKPWVEYRCDYLIYTITVQIRENWRMIKIKRLGGPEQIVDARVPMVDMPWVARRHAEVWFHNNRRWL